MSRNPHDVLGVPPNASKEVIEKAFRKKAAILHPDRCPGNKEAEEQFKEITAAYESLANPRSGGFGGGAAPDVTINFGDFFNFFRNEPSRGQPGDHIVLEIKTDLIGVLRGHEVDVAFSRKQICSTCDGVGGKVTKCGRCNGQGWEVIQGANMMVQKTCSSCGGRGQSQTADCPGCSGTGYGATKQDRLKTTLPAGVESGIQFKFKGRGNPGRNGGRPGHLYVDVVVEDHELFKVGKAGTLTLELPVSFTQVILGDEVEVPTLDKPVRFRIPAGTQSGTKFRLKRQGLPQGCNDPDKFGPDDYGDMIVEVKVETPTKVDERCVAEVERLAKLDGETKYYPLRAEFKKKASEI